MNINLGRRQLVKIVLEPRQKEKNQLNKNEITAEGLIALFNRETATNKRISVRNVFLIK